MRKRPFFRSVFSSDWHLGFKNANPKEILASIKSFDCEFLYLPGDIIDFWEISRKSYWDKTCNEILRYLLKLAKNGVQIFISTGNHDELLRQFTPFELTGSIQVADEFIHTTADGRRFLVIHCDILDFLIKKMPWLGKVGNVLYGYLLDLNKTLHTIRMGLGYQRYWSLANFLKQKSKKAVFFMNNFMDAALKLAKSRGVDGIICGHIHKQELVEKDGVLYANCGDFVESMSANAEQTDGKIVKLYWDGQELQVIGRSY